MMEAISDYVYSDAVNAGNTAYTNRNYEEAVTQYKKALEAKPGDEWTLLYLGHSYLAVGDTKNADAMFNELIQKYPARAAEVQPYITGTTAGGTAQGQDDQTAGDTGDGTGTAGNGAGNTGTAGNGDTGNTGNGTTGSGDTQGTGDGGDTTGASGGDGDVDVTGGGRLGLVP